MGSVPRWRTITYPRIGPWGVSSTHRSFFTQRRRLRIALSTAPRTRASGDSLCSIIHGLGALVPTATVKLTGKSLDFRELERAVFDVMAGRARQRDGDRKPGASGGVRCRPIT